MKYITKQSIITMAIVLFSYSSYAQKYKADAPAWVSDKGYWVIESNVKTPLEHTVRFYNNNNTMIYKESLTGVKLNINKRSVKMKLKRVLESSVTAWNQWQVPGENKNYVASILK